MTDNATQRVDLHVHTKYSGEFKLFILGTAKVKECYTEPEQLYDTMRQRGMTLVTATDHDTIDGCLQLADRGEHVFLSEEISARFPENGCIVHVLAWGISEEQHREIQRRRYNIYELVPYLREQEIVHSLAHPFSPVNQRLTPELLKKAFLLFDTVEVINGQKDPNHERAVRDVIRQVDRGVLERWANELDIEPVSWDRRWGITAGSDDHGGFGMARAYTEFDGPATFEGLAAAIRGRTNRVHGNEKTGKSYGHGAIVGSFNYFRHEDFQRGDGTYNKLFDVVRSGEIPDLETAPPFMQRLIPAAMRSMMQQPPPDKERILNEAHTPEFHDDVYELIVGTLHSAFEDSMGRLVTGVEEIDLDALIDEVPVLLRLALFNIPYYFGYRFFYGERRRAKALHAGIELPEPPQQTKRVAIFADSIDEINGVALGLRRIVGELRSAGHEIYLCGPSVGEKNRAGEGVVHFPSTTTFPLVGYSDITLGVPSLLEVARWLDENEIELVQGSTPGPAGVVAMLACRILGIPFIGHHHTNLTDYVYNLFSDRTVGRIVQGWQAWFYDTTQEVIVPSHAAGEIVGRLGVRTDKIHVIPRGVDAEKFHPDHADDSLWTSHGLEGRHVLLYVGRVSVEKKVPFLVDVFKKLVDAGQSVELAVVGDGPWRDEMERRLDGYPAAFLGFLSGDKLSAAFASADLFAFPSTTDTFGNVVLESLASGVPSIVTDQGGPSEIVRHRETGIVVPAEDEDRWIEAINELLFDEERLRKMGKAARAQAEATTFEIAGEALWSFYSQLIDRHRAHIRKDIR